MKVSVEVTVDVQDVFDELSAVDKEEFILDNIDSVDDDELIEILIGKGYNVTKE